MTPVLMSKKQAAALGVQLTLEGDTERTRGGGKRHNEEALHQAALIAHVRSKTARYPALRFLFATLNGLFIPPHLLAKAVEAGLCRGVLDVWLPVRRVDADGAIWSGVVIDVKKLKAGRPSPEQLDWAAHLAANGYRVYFCPGCVDAWRCLCCFADISGRDHVAGELEARENAISQMSV